MSAQTHFRELLFPGRSGNGSRVGRFPGTMPRFGLVLVVLAVIVVLMASPARGLAEDAPRAEATVQFVQGLTVEVIRAGATTGDPLQANAVLRAGDTLRTGEHSEATLVLSDGTILSVGELATVEIQQG